MTQLKDAVVLSTGATGDFGQQCTRQLRMAESQAVCQLKGDTADLH